MHTARTEYPEEAVGLAVAGAAVLLALGLASVQGKPASGARPCTVPAATGDYRRADAVPLFTLPESGGFLLGDSPILRDRIESTLREAFESREGSSRVAFVWPVTARRCADLRFLEQATRAAGGPLFDAAASGWPRESAGAP